MIRRFLIAASLGLILIRMVHGANPPVVISTVNFTGRVLTNTLITYKPLQYSAQSNRIVALIPFTNRTDSSGNVTIDQVIPGDYQGTIDDPRIRTTWTNTIPDTNVTIYAGDPNYISGARPIPLSDLRYPSLFGSGITTNVVGGRLQISASGGGGGITNINGQTNLTQVITNGTSGNDFNVSSSGGVHSLNLPTAGVATRGVLSSNDWATFMNKAASNVTWLALDALTNALRANDITTSNGAVTFTMTASNTLRTTFVGNDTTTSNGLTGFYGPQVGGLSNSVNAFLTNALRTTWLFTNSGNTFNFTNGAAQFRLLSGDPTFATSDRGPGRSVAVVVKVDGSDRTPTWSEGWRWPQGVSPPTLLTNNSMGVLSLMSLRTETNDVIAAWIWLQ